jgi:hypothetical protein
MVSPPAPSIPETLYLNKTGRSNVNINIVTMPLMPASTSASAAASASSSPSARRQAQALDDFCCPLDENKNENKSTAACNRNADADANANADTDCHDYLDNASTILTTLANPCSAPCDVRTAACLPSGKAVADTSTSSTTSTTTSSSDENDAGPDDLNTSGWSRKSRNTTNTNTSSSTSSSRRSRQRQQKGAALRTPERGRRKRSEPKRVVTTSPPPPPSSSSSTCDLVVRVGQQDFYHSSAVLGYASDYLKSQMRLLLLSEPQHQRQPQHGGSYYHIDFSHHRPEQWQVVLEYFQPRSLGGIKQLTWQQVPIVLPWFTQFGLNGLLNDIDNFLLETVVTQCQGELTLENLLLLARISYKSSLVTTQAQARQWLKAKLIDPRYNNNKSSSSVVVEGGDEIDSERNRNHDNDDHDDAAGSVLAWSLADLQLLSFVLSECDTLRDYLWESSMIQFLPHDLAVNDSKSLTLNPLFPYLLREGMMQLCVVNRAQMLIEKTRARMMAQAEAELDLDLVEANSILELDLRRARSDASHSDSNSSVSVMTPLQELWSQEMLQGLLQGVVEHLDEFALENEQQAASSTRKTIIRRERESRPTTSRKGAASSLRSRSKSKSKPSRRQQQQQEDAVLVAGNTKGNININAPAAMVESGSDTCTSPERPPVRVPVPVRVAPSSWDQDKAEHSLLPPASTMNNNYDLATMSITPTGTTTPDPPASRPHRTFEC